MLFQEKVAKSSSATVSRMNFKWVNKQIKSLS